MLKRRLHTNSWLAGMRAARGQGIARDLAASDRVAVPRRREGLNVTTDEPEVCDGIKAPEKNAEFARGRR